MKQYKWWNTWEQSVSFTLSVDQSDRGGVHANECDGVKANDEFRTRNLFIYFCHFNLIAIWTCLQYLTLSLSHSHTLPPLSVFISDAHPQCASLFLSLSRFRLLMSSSSRELPDVHGTERMNIWQLLLIWQRREWEKWCERKRYRGKRGTKGKKLVLPSQSWIWVWRESG